MFSKGIATIITLLFMYFVRPDAEPSRVAIVFISILLYEGIRWSVEYVQKVNKEIKRVEKIRLNLKARKEDGERLDEMLFNPYREVS